MAELGEPGDGEVAAEPPALRPLQPQHLYALSTAASHNCVAWKNRKLVDQRLSVLISLQSWGSKSSSALTRQQRHWCISKEITRDCGVGNSNLMTQWRVTQRKKKNGHGRSESMPLCIGVPTPAKQQLIYTVYKACVMDVVCSVITLLELYCTYIYVHTYVCTVTHIPTLSHHDHAALIGRE